MLQSFREIYYKLVTYFIVVILTKKSTHICFFLYYEISIQWCNSGGFILYKAMSVRAFGENYYSRLIIDIKS